MNLLIYVPVPGSPATTFLAPQSAIVGKRTETSTEWVTCYFEGNLYNAINLGRFHERLACAAGRCVTVYPTGALCAFPESELIIVGDYDAPPYRIGTISNPAALAAWAGEPIETITQQHFPNRPRN